MTNRIPYELISIEADKLIIRSLISELHYYKYYKLYLNFLEACGWTDKEYDEETLKRIDRNWDLLFKDKFIIWN